MRTSPDIIRVLERLSLAWVVVLLSMSLQGEPLSHNAALLAAGETIAMADQAQTVPDGSDRGVMVNGKTYSTISAAIASCTMACIVDARWHSETFQKTIVWPPFQVVLLLGPYTYSGPSSGPAIVVANSGANGSKILGLGMTASNQPNQSNGTTLKAAKSNPSGLLQLLSGSVGVVQGIEVANLTLDGSHSAESLMEIDAVRDSWFHHINFQNCTRVAIHSFVSNTAGDQGTQYNTLSDLAGGDCPQVLYADGNRNATSDFTQNHLVNWRFNFSSRTAAGIQFHQADGNQLTNIVINPTSPEYLNCVQFDSPVRGTVVGGLNNVIFGLHVGCVRTQHTVKAEGGTYGNRIYGYNQIENQAPPYGDSTDLWWEGTTANGVSTLSLGRHTGLAWSTAAGQADTYIRRCDNGTLSVDAGHDCDHGGNLLGNFQQWKRYDVTRGGSYALAGQPFAIADAPRVLSGFGEGATITSNNGTLSFIVRVGAGSSSADGTIRFPAAAKGWNCTCSDLTTQTATVFMCKQISSMANSATIANFSAQGTREAWPAGDEISVGCVAR
jgi:hypothetical protein